MPFVMTTQQTDSSKFLGLVGRREIKVGKPVKAMKTLTKVRNHGEVPPWRCRNGKKGAD